MINTGIPPLTISDSSQIEPIVPEMLWKLVPFVGETIARQVHHKRLSTLRREIDEQLKKRPTFPAGNWPCSQEQLAFARTISVVIAQVLKWPNSHFIPEDPLELVFWGWNTGTEVYRVIEEIEKAMGFRFIDYEQWPKSLSGDYGTFVDYLYQIKQGKIPQRTLTSSSEASC